MTEVVESQPPQKETETKKKKVKKLPMEPATIHAEIDTLRQMLHEFADSYVSNKPTEIRLPDDHPAHGDYARLDDMLKKAQTLYAKLYDRKPDKKKPVTRSSTTRQGFNKPRFCSEKFIQFANAYGELPENLKLIPLPETNGKQAISSQGQGSQMVLHYIDSAGLKQKKEGKSCIEYNHVLQNLLDDAVKQLGGIEALSAPARKNSTLPGMWEEDGKIYLVHATLQRLIPKLFDSGMNVTPSLFDDNLKVKENFQARDTHLKNITKRNNAVREAEKNRQREIRQREKNREKIEKLQAQRIELDKEIAKQQSGN